MKALYVKKIHDDGSIEVDGWIVSSANSLLYLAIALMIISILLLFCHKIILALVCSLASIIGKTLRWLFAKIVEDVCNH
jgi:membrane protein YqaA with SNARE-associated domain